MLRSSCRSIQFMFAVIIVLSLCEMTWGSNASFQRKSTPTKDNSIGILTADLNGDGIPDLIEANDRCNCISVQLANTDGTFRAPVDYTFPFLNQSRTQLATADLNHDGNADVVARTWSINSSSEFVTHILAYLGNGNGTLAAPIDSSFTGGGADMFVADVNSDGNVDAVVSTTDGSFTPHQEIVAVMDGDGHGNFAAPITVYGPTDTGAAPVAIGDFDADGHVDVAFQRTYGTCTNGGCSSNTLGILYGNGAEHSPKRTFLPPLVTSSATSPEISTRTEPLTW